MVLGPPKSRAGLRTVALPAEILPNLVGHLGRHTKPDADALVFTGSRAARCGAAASTG
jgi:hypothetical protein